jgi:pimeloyl-ACP methyl ester carboxylesterase
LLAVAGHIWFRPLSVMRTAGKFALWSGGIRGHYTQVGPYRVHYYEGGEGPPLVFVHGLGAESLNWVPAMLSYRHHFHVYAIDLLGHGETEQPDIAYSISQQSEMLHQFLLDHKATPADVVGVSMGGWITLKLAIDHPESVNKLVVADAAGLKFDTPITVTNFLPSNHQEFVQFMAMLTPRVHDMPYPLRRDFLHLVASRAWITRRIFASFLTYQDVLDGKLQQINAPTLIVWGAKENMIPLAVGEEMHQQIPKSSLLVCDDSGHLAIYECWNQLKPSVTEFLTAPQPTASSVRQIAIDAASEVR